MPADTPAGPYAAEVDAWRAADDSDQAAVARAGSLPAVPPGWGVTGDIQVVTPTPVCANCYGICRTGESAATLALPVPVLAHPLLLFVAAPVHAMHREDDRLYLDGVQVANVPVTSARFDHTNPDVPPAPCDCDDGTEPLWAYSWSPPLHVDWLPAPMRDPALSRTDDTVWTERTHPMSEHDPMRPDDRERLDARGKGMALADVAIVVVAAVVFLAVVFGCARCAVPFLTDGATP